MIDNIFILPYNFVRKGDVPMLSSSRKRIERTTALLRILQKCDSIQIDELARGLKISSSTLRRELRDLVNQSLVTIAVGKVSLATISNE